MLSFLLTFSIFLGIAIGTFLAHQLEFSWPGPNNDIDDGLFTIIKFSF